MRRPATGALENDRHQLVIASAAKQSSSHTREALDCFAALAMTADGVDHHLGPQPPSSPAISRSLDLKQLGTRFLVTPP
jgi:hypothetical protein